MQIADCISCKVKQFLWLQDALSVTVAEGPCWLLRQLKGKFRLKYRCFAKQTGPCVQRFQWRGVQGWPKTAFIMAAISQIFRKSKIKKGI